MMYRPQVAPTTSLYRHLNRNKTWHFDAWLYGPEAGRMYLKVETLAGGRERLWGMVYEITGDGLRAVAPENLPLGGAREATLQDRALGAEFDRLNSIHWRFVVPMIKARPEGFTATSACLHYIRAPTLEPFGEGAANFFRYGEE